MAVTSGFFQGCVKTAFRLGTVVVCSVNKLHTSQKLLATAVGTGYGVFSFLKPNIALMAAPKEMSQDYVFDARECMMEPITNINVLQSQEDMKAKMEGMIMGIQYRVCRALELCEASYNGKKFFVDKWLRSDDGGGGITCIIQDGKVFEKAGVNISVVHGDLPPAAIKQMRSRGTLNKVSGDKLEFFATGVSCVIHPRNPKVPTLHFNYRYFEVTDIKGEKQWWFGGGTDLTPYTFNIPDCVHFHSALKQACDPFGVQYYPKFKEWCDKYFFLQHRGISRGVGGIFFDDFEELGDHKSFEFVRSCANSVIPSYIPLVKKHMGDKYTDQDRQFQLVRRGHYVEFNLLYDRGTKFGLATPNARIESILMSLPLFAKWEYCRTATPGSNEAKLIEVLKTPREWAV